jgi:hypothetical protein
MCFKRLFERWRLGRKLKQETKAIEKKFAEAAKSIDKRFYDNVGSELYDFLEEKSYHDEVKSKLREDYDAIQKEKARKEKYESSNRLFFQYLKDIHYNAKRKGWDLKNIIVHTVPPYLYDEEGKLDTEGFKEFLMPIVQGNRSIQMIVKMYGTNFIFKPRTKKKKPTNLK